MQQYLSKLTTFNQEFFSGINVVKSYGIEPTVLSDFNILADKSKENNQNLIDFLEFQNALLLAPTIISSAIARDESRGAHYKVGFENEDEALKKHIVLQWTKEETCK